jgi:5'-nucleotidase / UDP-sugar diphosphatase
MRTSMSTAIVVACALWLTGAAASDGALTFTILHTNDEHSTLLPSPRSDHHPELVNPTRGGIARLAQAVADIRERKAALGEPVLLVSGGDFIGGSAFAWLLLEDRAPELSLLVEIGYDVVTIGNHEYDYGSDRLARYLAAAGYPDAAARTALVASNTLIPPTHPLAEAGIRQTHLVALDNGLTIGFFGLLGRHASGLAPLAPPVTFADPVATAIAAVAALRGAGADVVVAVTHAGTAEDVVLAERVPGIDVIVGGHTHEALYQPVERGGTVIVQAGSMLSYLGVLKLAYDAETGRVSVRNGASGQPHLQPIDHTVPEHPGIAAAMAAHTEHLNAAVRRLTRGRIRDVHDVVVTSDFALPNRPRLQETPMGNFVTDALRAVGSSVTGVPVDFAIQANGVIRGPITPGVMPYAAGEVTFFDLVERVGLGMGPDGEPGYPMISVYLTGEEVRRIMELSLLLSRLRGDIFFLQFSGLRMSYDPRRVLLGTIPFTNTPIPTTRAVLSAERGPAMVSDGPALHAPLPRGDQTLYHVITDYYLAAYLPMVGQLLPSLGLEMKDRDGNPITAEAAIVYRDGAEMKVWQAVVEYAAAQPPGPSGLPQIPSHYAEVAGRMQVTHATPLWIYPLAVLAAAVALIAVLRRRKPTGRKGRGLTPART